MPDPIIPEDIDLDAAPRRRDDVTSVELEGETVLYEPDAGEMHELDPLATRLWHFLDGSTSLRELAEDLADVYEGEPDRISADLVGFARELGRRGLLAGVAPSEDPQRPDR